jgi:hypothetical protein
MAPPELAPYYPVPTTKIVAMEHPMIIKNIDKGLTTLGTGVRPAQIMTAEDHTGCIPIYLRPVDPACAPLLSHNTATNNILLKLTVPKKTGRKRKRGSNDPWIFDSRLVAPKLTSEAAQAQHIGTDHGIPVDPQLGTSLSVLEPKLEPGTEPHRVTPAPRDDPKAMSSMLLRGAPQWRHCSKDQSGTSAELRSKARLDKPKLLRRALQDNVDQYQIEAVGSIWKTHRYRGMVDFHYSTTHGPFMARIHNDILPANLDTLKQFQFSPDKGIPHPNLELLPPPPPTPQGDPHKLVLPPKQPNKTAHLGNRGAKARKLLQPLHPHGSIRGLRLCGSHARTRQPSARGTYDPDDPS